MTEEEAKTKACCGPPQIAAQLMDEAVTTTRPAKCAGSACMAWRKDYEAAYDQYGNLPGFCGLAGRP